MTRTAFWLGASAAGAGMILLIHESSHGAGTGDAMDLLTTVVLLALMVAGVIVAVAVARRPRGRVESPVEGSEVGNNRSGWWYCRLYGVRNGRRQLIKEGQIHYPAGSSSAVEAEVIRRFATKYEQELDGMRLHCTARPAPAPESAQV